MEDWLCVRYFSIGGDRTGAKTKSLLLWGLHSKWAEKDNKWTKNMCLMVVDEAGEVITRSLDWGGGVHLQTVKLSCKSAFECKARILCFVMLSDKTVQFRP